MSLAIVNTRAQVGIDAPRVTVEVHISNGLPGVSMVGLPEMAVRESKDRVKSAIINSGFIFPTRKITINLAPADLPKEGGRYDLPIALGILMASQQIDAQHLGSTEVLGELALTGELRAVTGVLPAARCGSPRNSPKRTETFRHPAHHGSPRFCRQGHSAGTLFSGAVFLFGNVWFAGPSGCILLPTRRRIESGHRGAKKW